MQAGQIRQRVLRKVQEAVDEGDEETTAKLMEYARAVLVAIASKPDEEDIDLETLAVGTGTAARILGLHPEYLRNLLRRNALKGEKENGEYRIRFPDLVTFLMDLRRPALDLAQLMPVHRAGLLRSTLVELRRHGWTLWRQPPEEPKPGEQPA